MSRPIYLNDESLAELADQAIEQSGRSTPDLADELEVSQSAIVQARKVDEDVPGRMRKLRARIVEHLNVAHVDGPYFQIDPID